MAFVAQIKVHNIRPPSGLPQAASYSSFSLDSGLVSTICRSEIARSRNPKMKIMFMSGYPVDHIVGNKLEEGTTYLQKPIALSLLAAKLREVLDGEA